MARSVMKKIVLCLVSGLYIGPAMADEKCFIAKEGHKVLKQAGDYQKRYTPQSTFKIALSLMGYDTGILEQETKPEWMPATECNFVVNACKGSHNPQTWMRDSCVWYSQVLAHKLGFEKFKAYILKFGYGNQDVSGIKGKEDPLIDAWISSSLEISAEEQVDFLQKLVNNQLPVSGHAHEMTKKILLREELPGGWKLYGKTGNGWRLTPDKTPQKHLQHGWFVGWIEKGSRAIVFASHITDESSQKVFASFRARDEARNNLWEMIEAAAQ